MGKTCVDIFMGLFAKMLFNQAALPTSFLSMSVSAWAKPGVSTARSVAEVIILKRLFMFIALRSSTASHRKEMQFLVEFFPWRF